jgi:hypothetical protein
MLTFPDGVVDGSNRTITDIRGGPSARVRIQLNCGPSNTRLRPEFVSGETMPRRFSILMSGRRPVVKGCFEAVVNVSSAVMSAAC